MKPLLTNGYKTTPFRAAFRVAASDNHDAGSPLALRLNGSGCNFLIPKFKSRLHRFGNNRSLASPSVVVWVWVRIRVRVQVRIGAVWLRSAERRLAVSMTSPTKPESQRRKRGKDAEIRAAGANKENFTSPDSDSGPVIGFV